MIVLDAGALIALDRDDRRMWARLEEAARADLPVVVPACPLAQVWRDRRRQVRLALALRGCDTPALDGRSARLAGELCAQMGTADFADAQVALCSFRASAVYTSDPDDIRPLLLACGVRNPNVIAV